jgi:hypothetical protein
MSFASIKNFLPRAADRYKLGDQVNASLVCQRSRKCIAQKFPDYDDSWVPKKFVKGVLHITPQNSSARAQLYIQKNKLLSVFRQDDVLSAIRSIWIDN